MNSEEAWQEVQAGLMELVSEFGQDIVVIGGIAVYLHVASAGGALGLPLETTHDGHLFISLAGYSDLRDTYLVENNRRLNKKQVTIGTIEYDVYAEHNSELRVDFAELVADATIVQGIRIAGLEHLLVLKLSAFQDPGRRRSAHGRKDQRDIAKILVLLHEHLPTFGPLHFSAADLADLSAIVKNTAVFLELADGNAHGARRLRQLGTRYVGLCHAA